MSFYDFYFWKEFDDEITDKAYDFFLHHYLCTDLISMSGNVWFPEEPYEDDRADIWDREQEL